jgi:CO/xanthine dehydrogenase Mo-binding subunit
MDRPAAALATAPWSTRQRCAAQQSAQGPDFKLIGTPAKRLDTPDKVNGAAEFGIDVKVPGMKVATVAACPVFGGKLASVDDSKAKAIKGVQQVVRLRDAVAVVADHTWAAKKGLAALEIRWDEGPNAKLSTADIVRQLAEASQRTGIAARQEGSAKAVANAVRRFTVPFLAHATEPVNCRPRSPGWLRYLGGTRIPNLYQTAAAR